MREIKFKIYNKHEQIMSEVFEISELTDWDVICHDRFKGLSEISFCDLVWLQFTGLKDKNGKEIYEGDVLYYKYDYVLQKGDVIIEDYSFDYKGQIIFEDGCFVLQSFDKKITSTLDSEEGITFEIIGNIHENPELLKQKR